MVSLDPYQSADRPNRSIEDLLEAPAIYAQVLFVDYSSAITSYLQNFLISYGN